LTEAAPNWNLLRWNSYNRKHRASNAVTWEQIVAATGRKNYPSKYVQAMSDEWQEFLETECVTPENLIAEEGSIRSYFKKFNGVIGASNGTETQYVYVEHLNAGDFHGYPISIDKLRARGVRP
jgi:hypothetical protein